MPLVALPVSRGTGPGQSPLLADQGDDRFLGVSLFDDLDVHIPFAFLFSARHCFLYSTAESSDDALQGTVCNGTVWPSFWLKAASFED
jgi:hypothetical protein